MARIKIILNPVAGNGHAGQSLPEVKEMLNGLGIAYDIEHTTAPLHAVHIARTAAIDGYSIVVAMGGDGTINEVLNGLMEGRALGHKTTAMGVLGAGRGNDFAFGAGLPSSLERDCQIIAAGHRRLIDIGRVTVDGSADSRYFGNGIGIGFDTIVGFEAARMKHLSGFPAYLISALKTLFFYFTPPTVKIKLDDEEFTQPALMISIMNGRRMGGGFMMAPNAKPDDGLLDYCIISYGNKLRLLGLMLNIMKGNQAGKKEVKTGCIRRIEITALDGMLPAHGDGETLCVEGKHIIAEIIPAALEIITAGKNP